MYEDLFVDQDGPLCSPFPIGSTLHRHNHERQTRNLAVRL